MGGIARLTTLYCNKAVAPKDPWLDTFCNACEEFESTLTQSGRVDVEALSSTTYRALAKKYPYTKASEGPQNRENRAAEFKVVDKGSRRYVVIPQGEYNSIKVTSHSKKYRMDGKFVVADQMLIEVEGPGDTYRDSWQVMIQDSKGDGFLIEKPAGDLGSTEVFRASWREGNTVYPEIALESPKDALTYADGLSPTKEF